MQEWETLPVCMAAAAGAVLVVLVLVVYVMLRRRRRRESSILSLRSKSTAVFAPLPLHQDCNFRWAHHPDLAAAAISGGLSSFVFLPFVPSRNLILGSPETTQNLILSASKKKTQNLILGQQENKTQNLILGQQEKSTQNLILCSPEKTTQNLILGQKESKTQNLILGQQEIKTQNLILGSSEKSTQNLILSSPEKTTQNLILTSPEKTTHNLILSSTEKTTQNLILSSPEKTTQNLFLSSPEKSTQNLILSSPEKSTQNLILRSPENSTQNLILRSPEKPTQNLILSKSEKTQNLILGQFQNLILGSSEIPQKVKVPANGSFILSLPLPGPQPNNSPKTFLEEAYFEITILALHSGKRRRRHAGRKTKSLEERVDDKSRLVKKQKEEEEEEREVRVCLGLMKGGESLSFPPGSFPGSIGFCSNGCLDLDGINLALDSDKTNWGMRNKTVGCGFDPMKKSVFFTIDAKLVHLVRCNSDAFSHPLFPAISSNINVNVNVNLGQRPFKYFPVNISNGEDLFSMERIEDSLRSRKREWSNSFDDSDLFEICISK